MLAPKISVIIVSYNSEEFIEKCIKSALKFLPKNGEVIVVDNASTDHTVKKISNFKFTIYNLQLIQNKENLGFSKANNIGAKEAKGEYLFFLNPDTEIKARHSGAERSEAIESKIKDPIGSSTLQDDNGFFEDLISFYEQTPDVGIVAPKLVLPSGQVQPSVRNLPTVSNAIKEYILGQKGAYSEFVPSGDKPVEVEMAYGAALLIKKDLFEKLNGFDEKYFLYYEDINLCNRIRKMGKKIYYFPGVSIKHLVGATKTAQNKNSLNEQSAKKYHGIIEFNILQLVFLISRILKKIS